MQRLLQASAFTLILVLFLAAPAFGQNVTGNLQGFVSDEKGEPVQFANVVVTGPQLQGNRGTMTTSEGYFVLAKLPAGEYTVAITHVSYAPLRLENVFVALGRTTTLDQLTVPDKVYEEEKIVVTARRPLVDETTTEIGANLDIDQYDQLPLARDYRNISALLPLANQSYLGDEVNFSGATGMENRYFVDGVDVVDPERGYTATILPYNFIRQLEVKAGGYQAEYRSALGGMMNVVTSSGTNEFHGQVFGFYTNNDFAGDRKFGVTEPQTGDYAIYDAGAAINGPVAKDKLWFSLAYNPRIKDGDIQVPGTGFYEDHSEEQIFASKLTWRASEKSNVTLSVFGDPSTRETVGVTYLSLAFGTPLEFANPDPWLGKLETGGVNGSLVADYFVNDNLLFDMKASVVTRRYNLQPRTEIGEEEDLWVDNRTGILSGGFPTNVDNFSTQYTVDFNATYINGGHTLKAGLGYRSNRLDMDLLFTEGTQFSDTSFSIFSFDVDGTVQNRTPSAYVQDSWRVTRKLRLNVGMRWAAEFLIDSNGDVGQSILDEFQPRIGFTYQPGEPGTQKIFGSFGRYYHTLSMTLAAFNFTTNRDIRFEAYEDDPRTGGEPVDAVLIGAELHPEVDDLEGQHYDEFSLGYERQVMRHTKVGVTGLYRTLRAGIEDGYVAELDDFRYSNPGSGFLTAYPNAKRNYSALILSAGRSGADHFSFLASYVLSKNEGIYPGLYNNELQIYFPNYNASFDHLEALSPVLTPGGWGYLADGDLPNDRRHVLKASGAYRFDVGLTVGSTFIWQSGTPLSEYVGTIWGSPTYAHGVTRGTAGNTGSIWDINFRFMYDLAYLFNTRVRPRLLLDVFHVGSQRDPVNYDQLKYFNVDDNGNQIDPNPSYGLPTGYQPPMAMRMGVEIDF